MRENLRNAFCNLNILPQRHSTTKRAGRRNGSGHLDSLPLANNWILLSAANEILTQDLADEIEAAIRDLNLIG